MEMDLIAGFLKGILQSISTSLEMASTANLELHNKDQLPGDLSKPILVHDLSGTTIKTIKIENIVGITGAGIRLILDNWNTYRDYGWITALFIPPYVKPPGSSTIPIKYSESMKDQVDAIAELYDALLDKRDQDAPKFNAAFTDKLKWGMENVDALKGLTTDKVLGWLAAGVANVNFEDI